MSDLAKQTKNAFDFIQKLFIETSYLIKEVEGQLQEEPERFNIIRPSGYSVAMPKSTGLEPAQVKQWIPETLTVFFTAEELTELKRGRTQTPFGNKLKLLTMHIAMFGKDIVEPIILAGCIGNITIKPKGKKFAKFENWVSDFANYSDTLFQSLSTKVDHESSYWLFKGKFVKVPLFVVENSDDIREKLIQPMLSTFRTGLFDV